MKWVEIITLRSLAKANRHFVNELLRQVLEEKGSGLRALIRIYRDTNVQTDLSIHIHWETETQPPCESPLGQRLSYALRNLGLLNHTLWAEIETLEFRNDQSPNSPTTTRSSRADPPDISARKTGRRPYPHDPENGPVVPFMGPIGSGPGLID